MSTLSDTYNEISEVAELIHQKGWAEKNAGNFSIRIDEAIEFEDSSKHYPLLASYSNIADKVFIVTGKGKRMRNIARSPAGNTILIKINANGDSF